MYGPENLMMVLDWPDTGDKDMGGGGDVVLAMEGEELDTGLAGGGGRALLGWGITKSPVSSSSETGRSIA